VDRRSVRRWNAAYRRQEAGGLAARPVPGRPWKLTARQRAQLEDMLVRGAGAGRQPPELTTKALTERIELSLLWNDQERAVGIN
jgi:transposase